MGGANDLLFSKISNEKLLQQYERLLDIIARETPRTRVYIQSLLPLNEAHNEAFMKGKNARFAEFNALLRFAVRDTQQLDQLLSLIKKFGDSRTSIELKTLFDSKDIPLP